MESFLRGEALVMFNKEARRACVCTYLQAPWFGVVMVGSSFLLSFMVLAVGCFLAWRGRPLPRLIIFGSALTVSALLFFPGAEITGFVGAESVERLRHFSDHTLWEASVWAHFLIFLWLGLLLWLCRPDLRNWKSWALVVVLAVGAELAQDLAPERSPRLEDVISNLAGGVTGLCLAIFFLHIRKRW